MSEQWNSNAATRIINGVLSFGCAQDTQHLFLSTSLDLLKSDKICNSIFGKLIWCLFTILYLPTQSFLFFEIVRECDVFLDYCILSLPVLSSDYDYWVVLYCHSIAQITYFHTTSLILSVFSNSHIASLICQTCPLNNAMRNWMDEQ